jgi:allantoicase
VAASTAWNPLLPRTQLKANARHLFTKQLLSKSAATHVRFNIFPDGGVSRLRLIGRPERPEDRFKGLELLNQLPRPRAVAAFVDCCGSKKWAEEMATRRPFADSASALDAADKIWEGLGQKEWVAAFRHHPPIGGEKAAGKQSAKAHQWSRSEQAMAQKAPEETMRVLAAANQAYHAAFGYVFLICAAGKTTEEILKSLKQRLSNDPETELRIAADEQRKITRLRLEKILAP